jgi:hypothetical protein
MKMNHPKAMKRSIQNSVNILYPPFLFFSMDTHHHVFSIFSWAPITRQCGALQQV